MDEYITKLTEVLDAKTLEIMKSGNVNRMNEFGQLLNIPVTELKNLVEEINQLQVNNIRPSDYIEIASLMLHLSELDDQHEQTRNGRSPRKNYTVTPLLDKLPIAPYSKMTNLFGERTTSLIVIDRGEHKSQEPVSPGSAFSGMFPGKISYRYGDAEMTLIYCGSYDQDFRCDLRAIHDFEDGIYQLPDGKEARLVKKFYGRDVTNLHNNSRPGFPICQECLSLNTTGDDHPEQCEHLRTDPQHSKEYVQTLNSRIKKNTIETAERDVSETTTNFLPVFREMFEKVEFSNKLELLTYASGFTRSATIGTGQNRFSRSVYIEYDPCPAYKTTTKGLILKLKPISDDFITLIMDNNVLARDVLIDVFAQEIERIILDTASFPRKREVYELELILSGVIKALQLDEITDTFDWNQIVNQLDTNNFRNNFKTRIQQEIQLYSRRPSIEVDIIDRYAELISSLSISEDLLRQKIKKLITTSICYTAYISGQITSGTTERELSFLQTENNEIILYDNVEGGNGASKLIFDYFGGQFSSQSLNSLKPAFFQEVFIELLQPCSQGVAERIYFQKLDHGFTNLRNNLITYRLDEINSQESNSPDEFDLIKNTATIRNIMPFSIGKRTLDPTAREDNPKIQETANICIHGCPECILLNSWDGPSDRVLEKYYVSKYILDEYFQFIGQGITVDGNNEDEIKSYLSQNGSVIISQQITTTTDLSNVLTLIDAFIGMKITFDGDEKIGKLSGVWFNSRIGSNEIDVHMSLSLI